MFAQVISKRIMRLTRTIIFVFVLLPLMLSQPITVFVFKLNQSYIAKNLCENRAKPAMRCNGKCKLSKKLQEENTENNKTYSFPNVEIVSCQSFFPNLISDAFTLIPKKKYSLYRLPFYENDCVTELLRPPSFYA